ncbi:MAG: winged helix-turn-helix transcriptional regulator [Euryarchaeota archaeon]|nr:winged helix-turn-helix transcriptional regulator [Euryarchaeota archaeon]
MAKRLSPIVDDLDLQIMRRMGLAPFLVWPHSPSSIRPAQVARSLHVSTDTVKRRLAAMAAAGVFHGTQVFPNPRLLGLRTASFHFRMGDAARKRVPRAHVSRVGGVLGVFDMVGGDRCVDVAFGDDAARETLRDELSSLLGASSSHFVDYATPEPVGELSPLDWRILAALRAKPDTSLGAAAAACGASLRTVKRRFDRMARDGALEVIGLFDPGAISGQLVVDLLFHLVPGAGKRELATVLNAFRSRWVAQWSPPDHQLGHLALVVVATSPREVEDLRREGESLAPVERCDALILEGVDENWSWIDARIAQRTGQPRKALAPSPAWPIPLRPRKP